MADLAYQHITDAHPGGTRGDFGRRSQPCGRHGSIHDGRRHRPEAATPAFVAPADRFAAGAIIEIG
jgi:hypothetical protein